MGARPMNHKKLTEKLEEILREQPRTLKAEVAQEAIDQEDIPCFFRDLAQGGCASGMVGKLVYYTDTAKFYDRHYDEIEGLREDYEEETGKPLQPKGDLKNWFAWFAFEQTAWTFANELEIEI